MLPVILAAVLPTLLWDQGVETAPALRRAGIECVDVPAERAPAWQEAGFCHQAIEAAALRSFRKVPVPRVLWKANVASATSSPWIIANGWRFERLRGAAVLYELPRGTASLAAAEAFAYDVPAVLRIDPGDLDDFGSMLAFLRRIHGTTLPALANVGVVDDGSALVGEVMNLLARRNLLFRAVSAPEASFDLSVEVGSRAYSRKEAADPAAFAMKVRRQLTDDKRLVRIFGSDLVLARLTGNGRQARLHLLNYGGKQVQGLRVRLRGSYKPPKLAAAGYDSVWAEDYLSSDGTTEFTLPEMQVYAVADLEIVQ